MDEELKRLLDIISEISPKSFINRNNELIVVPKDNIYFRLEDIKTDMDLKCKVIAWLSRPSCKGVSKYWQKRVRDIFNRFLGTNFNKDEMMEIYTYLGNDVNRTLCVRFIESNYDISLLQRKRITA
ncbi:hypothetical protein P4571_08420 [Niallia alba]|uniref:hypothetical protein n=1 Tax=Niallia alba TaxID=2729105 RepID=UPI002E1C6F38|nr:hypothetical protein [Niallia alba]